MYILHPFTILDPPLLHVCLIDMKFLVSKEPSFCVSSVMLSCCVLVYSYLTAWGLYPLYSVIKIVQENNMSKVAQLYSASM